MNNVFKPCLMATDLVRATLDGEKTATRRIIKPQPEGAHMILGYDEGVWEFMCGNRGAGGVFCDWSEFRKEQFSTGDVLWVRETWMPLTEDGDSTGAYIYKASDKPEPDGDTPLKWRPSIHMPKEAARLFLEVTGGNVERLQDITEEQAITEGIDSEAQKTGGHVQYGYYRSRFALLWDKLYSSPRPVNKKGWITGYVSYPWHNIRETRTFKGMPWEVYGNPWVEAVEYKRVARPEGF